MVRKIVLTHNLVDQLVDQFKVTPDYAIIIGACSDPAKIYFGDKSLAELIAPLFTWCTQLFL